MAMTPNETSGRDYQYSDEELLGFLQDCNYQEGKVTVDTYKQYRKRNDAAAPSVIVERFGSWVAAKEEAGVGSDGRVSNSRPREYSTAEMVEMVRDCAQRHGAATQSTFDDDDEYCSSGAIVKRFGSWTQAKQEAGLDVVDPMEQKYSDDEILAMLRACETRHGKVTTAVFNDDEDFCSASTVSDRFGDWTAGKREAGVL